jgi:hypothetical protein
VLIEVTSSCFLEKVATAGDQAHLGVYRKGSM